MNDLMMMFGALLSKGKGGDRSAFGRAIASSRAASQRRGPPSDPPGPPDPPPPPPNP